MAFPYELNTIDNIFASKSKINNEIQKKKVKFSLKFIFGCLAFFFYLFAA